MTNWFGTAWILAINSWQENLRSRFYQLSAVFGIVFVYISLLLGVMAADQELRVLLDFGLALIELLGMAGGVYGATTVILREMETKPIYLILARPVTRGQYLLGRFSGLALSVAASMALMAAAHLTVLFAKGWSWDWLYAAALIGSYFKALTAVSLGVFFALFSSSSLTALAITVILWTLGHFLPELRYMIRWGSHSWTIAPLQVLSYVVPDLQLFNARDRLADVRPLVWLGYGFAYCGAWLGLGRLLLRDKEF